MSVRTVQLTVARPEPHLALTVEGVDEVLLTVNQARVLGWHHRRTVEATITGRIG